MKQLLFQRTLGKAKQILICTGKNYKSVSAGKMRSVQELDEKDKSIVFSMIDIMLTNKKFKDFFQKNVAAL
jgi:hypothetical protein